MLTGPEQLVWVEALWKAFSPQEFADLLLYRLDDMVGEYASESVAAKQAFGQVVAGYSRRDREQELIAKAVEFRPRNAALLRIAGGMRAAAAPGRNDTEQLIRATNSFLDIGTWLERAGRLQVCVCRIELATSQGTCFGTGFLVAPDLVMTNFHVVESLVATARASVDYCGPRALPTDLTCRFDFKVLANGHTATGTTFTLAEDWCLASSPNAPPDREATLDELDFAILRLSESAGAMPVGTKLAIPGDLRGHIELSSRADTAPFAPHSPLFIIQHPEAAPLKLALETNAIISLDSNRTRVRYRTNTEPGSSGSPCFDQNWTLVALHHSGVSQGVPPFRCNEGIPIDTIAAAAGRQGIRL